MTGRSPAAFATSAGLKQGFKDIEAENRFGGLDVVVNNAGYGYLGAVEETTDAEVRRMFEVQIFGVWNVLRAAVPGMRAARRGHIVNVSSVLGLTAFPGWALHCSAKYALEGLSDALAGEVAEFGIKVNTMTSPPPRTSRRPETTTKAPAGFVPAGAFRTRPQSTTVRTLRGRHMK